MVQAYKVEELVDGVALRQAVDSAVKSPLYSSRVAKLPVGSWQAEVLKNSDEVVVATSSAALRDCLSTSDTVMVFIPSNASVDQSMLDRLLMNAPFSKTIVWETDQ